MIVCFGNVIGSIQYLYSEEDCKSVLSSRQL